MSACPQLFAHVRTNRVADDNGSCPGLASVCPPHPAGCPGERSQEGGVCSGSWFADCLHRGPSWHPTPTCSTAVCSVPLSPFVSLCLTLPVSVSLNMDSACCFFCCFCSCLQVCRCSLCKGDVSLSSAALDHPPDLRLSCSLNASRSGLMSPEKLFFCAFPLQSTLPIPGNLHECALLQVQ